MAGNTGSSGAGQADEGISLQAFVTALAASLVVFGIQSGVFLVIRNKLARIFKPKTFLVPERERTDPPPSSPWGMLSALLRFKDREIIKKCGLDAYFFLRYLQTLLIIFIPMACILIPVLVPLNYVGGINQDINSNSTNATSPDSEQDHPPTGLDTLAWGNVRPSNRNRYWAHLILAIMVIGWVCFVFFAELRVYIKVRQDWLTTAEHRLRASATTVMVSGIPEKWLNEASLRKLFDVFPGGVRNIWLTRDLTELLDKIDKRDRVHKQLESAQTDLIRECKRQQIKKKNKEEKEARKAAKVHRETRAEKQERLETEDAAAQLQAAEVRGSVSIDGSVESASRPSTAEGHKKPAGWKGGISKLGQGLGKGFETAGRTGHGISHGAKTLGHGLEHQVETTNGFVMIGPSQAPASTPSSRGSDRRQLDVVDEKDFETSSPNRTPPSRSEPVMGSLAAQPRHGHHASEVSRDEILDKSEIEMDTFSPRNRRKTPDLSRMYNPEKTKWYEFWKPPSGGFASPEPQGYEGTEFPFKKKTSFWQDLKGEIPFMNSHDIEKIEYPEAYEEEKKEAQEAEEGAEWEKWVKKSKRPTHRLAIFEWTPGWLPGLPGLNKKVDTIYWCRAELARLNVEIEADQAHPDRYPLMKSAFVQFNHQVAAHMACQSVIHHIPKHMAPRMVEVSPNDVLWDNMAVPWWSEWVRTLIVLGVVVGMIILWTFPVAFTSTLSQIDQLIADVPWLGFLARNDTVYDAVKSLAGILPAILLSLLLILVPIVMQLLAGFKGAKTGSQKAESVQKFYFAFLFIQVFFVVSLASGLTRVLGDVINNPTSITEVLARNLPKSANYFFSYMILQALSVSSGTLLQIGSLFNWYIVAKMMNSTSREKWATNTKLPEVKWGSYFPVYTNFACIALIYSVIAPIISIFAIITFSLLWIANRYTMLYVNRLTLDTGGVLYPRAINQTFTGLYVMEICLIGLFFIVRDQYGNLVCTPHAIIMIVVTVLTVFYQFLIYMSFGQLFRYLPITFEDEACIRDEAFQRAQDSRLGLLQDNRRHGEEGGGHEDPAPSSSQKGALDTLSTPQQQQQQQGGAPGSRPTSSLRPASSVRLSAALRPVKGAVHVGKAVSDATIGKAEQQLRSVNATQKAKRKKDLEAQRAIGEALYGGYHDEIEDMTPEERDKLVRIAFTHKALRARRPAVWIPRDDMGVSDDEVRRTRQFSKNIWISNEGTALDSKARVVYGRAPPDFSELDIVVL